MIKRTMLLIPLLLLTLLFVPHQAFAIDFTIPESTIDATLLENGDVSVKETHVYDFDDDFNGLTRTLYQKENTEITNVEASENGQPLEVEQDGALYKIIRPGSYETVTLNLTYTITNGATVYQDVADFNWSFFDSSGEVPYEDMTVIIHPPAETDDVIAYGKDETFGKETIQEGGTVQYSLGTVSDGSNGFIRVAYPSDLFTNATVVDEEMKETILTNEQEVKDEAAAFTSMQDRLSNFAVIFIPLAGLLLFVLILGSYLKSRQIYKSFEQEYQAAKHIPKQKLSMLATILYTKSTLRPEAMAAGLLDLMRKGFVKEHDTNQFTLIQKEGASKSEQILIEWLFDAVGDGKSFSLQQLESYAKEKKNHEAYQQYDHKWKTAIGQEMKEANLHQNKTAYRLTIGLASLIFVPLFVLFPLYDLPMWLFFSILLFIGYVGYAIFYHPRTTEGARIVYEWNQFSKQAATIPTAEMTSWKQDDLMRAIIYGIGTGDKNLKAKNTELEEVFKGQPQAMAAYSFDVTTFIAISVVAQASMNTASSSAAPSSSPSGGSPGGGVGGSGGGSGAF
ncbi:DUF2207 domain-containing protein [Alkalicoccobacillus gibsonii]|uniref:DUF2207 domain-containing protein n=1 Tax=Alkalicoccobacillus gibsonii TaxID=79881 RepID=UPI003513DB86